MTELEETLTALKTLFDKVDVLQSINIRDILRPGIFIHNEKTLQAAYDALTQVERIFNALAMEL